VQCTGKKFFKLVVSSRHVVNSGTKASISPYTSHASQHTRIRLLAESIARKLICQTHPVSQLDQRLPDLVPALVL
jgi:hypothetical protein